MESEADVPKNLPTQIEKKDKPTNASVFTIAGYKECIVDLEFNGSGDPTDFKRDNTKKSHSFGDKDNSVILTSKIQGAKASSKFPSLSSHFDQSTYLKFLLTPSTNKTSLLPTSLVETTSSVETGKIEEVAPNRHRTDRKQSMLQMMAAYLFGLMILLTLKYAALKLIGAWEQSANKGKFFCFSTEIPIFPKNQ